MTDTDKIIDLNKLNLLELKSIAYDLLVQIENLNKQFSIVQQTINARISDINQNISE